MKQYYTNENSNTPIGAFNITTYSADKFKSLISNLYLPFYKQQILTPKGLSILIEKFQLIPLIVFLSESNEKKKSTDLISNTNEYYENENFVIICDKSIRPDGYTFYTSFSIKFPLSSLEKVNEFKELLWKSLERLKKVKARKQVNFIVKNGSGNLSLETIYLPKKETIDFSLNYNDDFDYKKIEKDIKDKKNGLILLGGDPGTGKSTFIRWLAGREKKRVVVFIPSYMLSSLESPDFMTFTLRILKDTILVIEDSEKILLDRKTNTSSAISTILNMSSGTLGLATNITIICTYNTTEKIDTALFRKGRLLYKYNFGPLEIDKANKLSEKLGHNIRYLKPVTLAEVMTVEDNNHTEETKKSLGYNFNSK